MTMADVRAALSGGASVEQVTKRVLSALVTSESGPERLNAFITYDFELAMAAAADVDAALAAGEPLRLAGIPVAVKDNLCTVDHATTCASRILANFVPPYDATAVRRLRAAGAIIVGKTNLDEFAMGSTTESSVFGRTRNPRDQRRVTGGSSGGSAAAVAAGLVPVALGTDTAGSVRQPAAFCGVVGFKPSYGRISRYGLVAHASSLDTVGMLANDVGDIATVFDVIGGEDPADSTSWTRRAEVPAEVDLRHTVIGVPREYFARHLHEGVHEYCSRAIHRLAKAGAEIREVELPHTHLAIPAYYALSTAEAASNLARYDGVRYGVRARDASTVEELYDRTRTIGFGPEVKRRIMLGLHVLSEAGRVTFARAQTACTCITADFEKVFREGVRFLFTPTTATPAFISGEKTDPYELYTSDMLTVGANLSGIPAISVPIGTADGLPIGGQLLAPRGHDEALLAVARQLQELLR